MKEGQVLEFSASIDKNKDLFDLPELDDREFEFMLAKARIETQSENALLSSNHEALKIRLYNFVGSMIISPRVAAVLIIAILTIGFFWLSDGSSNINNITASSPAGVDQPSKKRAMNTDNVVKVSTYTERHF